MLASVFVAGATSAVTAAVVNDGSALAALNASAAFAALAVLAASAADSVPTGSGVADLDSSGVAACEPAGQKQWQ